MVFAAESKSEHPLAKAITAHAKDLGIEIGESSEFAMEADKGVGAVVAGKKLNCGRQRYPEEKSTEIPRQA